MDGYKHLSGNYSYSKNKLNCTNVGKYNNTNVFSLKSTIITISKQQKESKQMREMIMC